MKSGLACVAATTFIAMAGSLQLAAQDNASTNTGHHLYKLIDMGTFGGPNSYLAYPPPGTVLSNQGSVVGIADTAEPDPFCPHCFNDGLVSYAFRWHDGILTNLGALPGKGNSVIPFLKIQKAKLSVSPKMDSSTR